MSKFRVWSTAECKTKQRIEAETPKEAYKQWEDSDTSLDEVDEDSVEGLSFEKIEQLIDGKWVDVTDEIE